MNIKNILPIVGLTALLVTGLAANATAQTPAPGTLQAGTTLRQKGERHPEIRKAIKALENAKVHLKEAAHDFGGHRKDALDAVDNAIAQLKLALQFDKK